MSQLPSWPRPHLQPGGYDAFLFFWVPGEFKRLRESPSGAEYRMGQPPPELEIIHHARATDEGAFDQMLKGPFGRFLNQRRDDLPVEVRGAPEYVIVKGTIPNPTTLDYLRDTVGLIQWLLDTGGVGALDWQTLEWSSRRDWRTDYFEPGYRHLIRHARVLASPEEDGSMWFHTRGMRKFGRPDLSLHHVMPERQDAVLDLFKRFIGMQAQGAVIEPGVEIDIASLPEHMSCHPGGSFDDPDFNNPHVEIRWPLQ